jgi:hypothetical protein
LEDIRRSENSINENQKFLTNYGFTLAAVEWINGLQRSYKKKTVDEFASDANLKNLRALHSNCYDQLRTFTDFPPTLKELEQVAKASKTIMEFTNLAEKYIRDTRAKFESFADPSVMTLQDCNTYFVDSNSKTNYKRYTLFLNHAYIQEFKIGRILDNALHFEAFKKIKLLADSVKRITEIDFMKRKQSTDLTLMLNINNKFGGVDPKNLKLQELVVFQGRNVITEKDLMRELPECLAEISKSPNCLKFIKEKPDELIRSMRDDCGSEDTDLVNKLDAINRSLKRITNLQALETIDDVMVHVWQLEEKQKGEIKDFILALEASYAHLDHIFEKAQKGTHFHKKQVLSIMNNSTLIIKFDPKTDRFETSAEYSTGQVIETVIPDELIELLNLIKIVVSDVSSHHEDDIHSDRKKLLDFSKLGDVLRKLVGQIEWMRKAGLINTSFTESVCSKFSQLSQKSIFFSGDEKQGTQMNIKFSHGADSLRHLEGVVEELDTLKDLVTTSITSSQREWTLFSYYSGRKLFYLTELLDGRIKVEEDAKEVMEMISESLSIPRMNDLRNCKTKIQYDLEDRLSSVADYMKTFTQEAGLQPRLEDKPHSLSAYKNQIKVVSTESKKREGSPEEATINEYEVILKILVELDEQKLSMSQFFYCSDDVNFFDLAAFLHRALHDPFRQFYFIINADSMNSELISEMSVLVEKIFSDNASNSNLLIFLNDPKKLEQLSTAKNFTVCDTEVKELLKKTKNVEIVKKFKNVFSRNQIVHSVSSGMGKSRYIQTQAQGKDLVELFLAGELTESTVTKRITNAISRLRNANSLVLCIKLDYIEDYHDKHKFVDFLLFTLCFLMRVPTEKGCFTFTKDKLSRIFLELGNTFVKELLATSTIFKLFFMDECAKEIASHTLIYHVNVFETQNVQYVSDPQSAEQKALKLISLVKGNKIETTEINSAATISKNEYRDLIDEYFIEKHCKKNRSTVTYAQFQFWVQIISRLAEEMDSVRTLKPQNLGSHNREIRKELANEIIYFASHLCNFTVEQAKSSQNEMKEIVKKIGKETNKTVQVESYTKKFAELKPWDCSLFILPMFNQQSYMVAMYHEDLLKKEDYFRKRGQRRCIENIIRENQWYQETLAASKITRADLYTRLLAAYLGEEWKDLRTRIENFKENAGFALNGDNFMKICLMIIKAKLRLPIVIMGESGCGKTYLSEFVSQCLLQYPLKKYTLYSGVTELELLNFMSECVSLAKAIPEDDFWVFFDEFNTSSLQSIISEIMIDRICSVGSEDIRIIPKNMVFVAACNPYRLKIKQNNFGLVPKSSDTILSHRVYPIPERLMNFIWDFGQLSEEDEKRYTNRMIKNAKVFDEKKDSLVMQLFSDAVYKCHCYVRNIEERSGVSLRDIKRVIIVFKWFIEKFTYLKTSVIKDVKLKTELTERAIINKSLMISIMVCYGLRLNGRTKEQEEFMKTFEKALDKLSMFSKPKAKTIIKELSDFVDKYCFQELEKVPGIIPEDIAPTKPLKENFLAMLVAFDTHIPLIICGAPGTSKTLCTHIIVNALNPDNLNKADMPFFKQFKAMYSMYYGGSETSTAEGIKKVFTRGEKYRQDAKGDDTPTVIFDEIGLAELSKHNPLKILHPYLEKPESKISFLGMSNWTLDLSKMNRLIYISRPELTIEDLNSIFDKVLLSFKVEKFQTELKDYLYTLADAYIEYISWQKKYGKHKHFHGSRDMYAVSKFILHRVQESHMVQNSEDMQKLIKLAIERNFNGTLYTFDVHDGKGQGIPISSVPGLKDEGHEEHLTNLKFSDLNSLETIDKFCTAKLTKGKGNSVHLMSAAVFKRFYLSKIKSKAAFNRTDFLEDVKTVELVEQNIREKNCRFMMLRSEGDLVDTVVLERLKSLYKDDEHYKNKIIDWRGVQNHENDIELLSTLKSYISLGYIVVMKNLDSLYGSLYDLFNQKYMVMGGQKMCFLYYGESKQKVVVHPLFKTIIIESSLTDSSSEDIELKQPAPFLNRFEKYYVRISSLLDLDHIKNLIALRKKSIEASSERNSSIIGLSIDLITSICVGLEELLKAKGISDSEEAVKLEQIGTIKVPKEQVKAFLKMSTTDLLITQENSSEQQLICQAHSVNSFSKLLSSIRDKDTAKVCVFTFSHPELTDSLISKNERDMESYRIINAEELAHIGIEKRLNKIREMEGHILIKMTHRTQLDILSQVKSAFNENSLVKKILIVIHLDRDFKKNLYSKHNSAKSLGIDFWNQWDNMVIDDLEETRYKEISESMKQTLATLVDLPTEEDQIESEDQDSFEDDEGQQSLGVHIFNEAVLSVIQQLAHNSQDFELKNNIRHVYELFKSNKVPLLSKILKRAIPISEELHDRECRAILKEYLKNEATCPNIPKILESHFKEFSRDKLLAALTSLNNHLKGLHNYSRVIMNNDASDFLKELFIQHFIKSLKSWNHSGNTNSLMLQIPFMSDFTSEVGKRIDELIKNDKFKDMIKMLSTNEIQAYTDRSGNKEELCEKLSRGQMKALDDIASAVRCTEEYNHVLEKELVHPDDPLVVKAALFDILIQTEFKKTAKFLSSSALFDNFYRLIEILFCEPINERSLETRLKVSVYLLSSISFLSKDKSHINLLAEIIEGSNYSIDDLQKELEEDDQMFMPIQMHKLMNLISIAAIEKSTDTASLALLPSLRFGSEHQSHSIVNFITLWLLLEAPLGKKFLDAAAALKQEAEKEKKRLGRVARLQFIRENVKGIMNLVELPTEKVSRARAITFIGQYVNLCATEFDVDYFISKSTDSLFSKLELTEQESICNNIVRAIIKKLHEARVLKDISVVDSLITLKDGKLEDNSDIRMVDEMIGKLAKCNGERAQMLICILIDRLTITNTTESTSASNENGVLILEYTKNHFDWQKSLFDLWNILCIVAIRSSLSKPFIESINPGYEYRRQLNTVIDGCPSPEEMLSKPNSYFTVYFLQSLQVYTADLSNKAPIFNAVTQYFGHITQSKSKKITMLDDESIALYNRMAKELEACLYKEDISGLRAIFESTPNNVEYYKYVFACTLINKFVNTSSEDVRTIIEQMKEFALKRIDALQFPEIETLMMKKIVDAKAFDFSQFLADGQIDQEFSILLSKLFYQHMALVVCFRDRLGYNLQAYSQPRATIDSAGFKANIVSNPEMDSFCGLFHNTMFNRRLDPMFRIYQELGMYRCSCFCYYGVGNCGRVTSQMPCPNCRQPIGGNNYRVVARNGHIHIPNFESLIQNMNESLRRYPDAYYGHSIIHGQDSMLSPLKVKEVGVAQIDANRDNAEYCKKLGLKLLYRHMFDHFFLISLQEILGPQEKERFREASRGSIDLRRRELNTMADRRIENIEQYFLAHVKNDIEMLRRDLSLRNVTDAFDWIRNSFSLAAKNLSGQIRNQAVVTERIQPNLEYFDNPVSLLTLEESKSQKQNSNDEQGAKGVLKMLVNKRIPLNVLESLPQTDEAVKVKELFKVMRHNFLASTDIFSKFKESVVTSPHGLLKLVVEKQEFLTSYAAVVMSSFKLVNIFNTKYSRAFTFDESLTKTLRSLKDPEVEDAFEDFVNTWKNIITPSILEAHKDVFEFAFMCAQDFDAMTITKDIIEKGLDTPVFRFLFIDRNEQEGKEFIYIKSVVSTMVNRLHNRIMELANKILGINEDPKHQASQGVYIEYCNRDSFVGQIDLQATVLQNYYFNSQPERETSLVFDFNVIENECARMLLKKKILVDDKDLTNYAFKYSRGTQNVQYLKKMAAIFGEVALDPRIKGELQRLEKEDRQSVKDFILEVGELVYLNYKYDNPQEILLNILGTSKISRPSGLRLEEVQVSQLSPMYNFICGQSSDLLASGQTLTPDELAALRKLNIGQIEAIVNEAREIVNNYGDAQTIASLMDTEMATFFDSELPGVLTKLKFKSIGSIESELAARRQQVPQPAPQRRQTVRSEMMDAENM